MKALLSRYRPRYIRSLVYMLQSTEYQIPYFWEWLSRTKDFSNLEQRSQLNKTAKARILLAIGWLIVGAYWLVAILFATKLNLVASIVALAIVVLATPYILMLAICIPVWILGLAQKIYERVLINKTRAYLNTHPAVRIGIAGSYGKTTMRHILFAILSQGKRTATPIHNYNTPIGIGRFVKTLSGNEEVLIFELGEYYPGDIKQLSSMVMPSIGVITGVNEAHLERFKSLERTTATVFELADWLGDKSVYVNAESLLAKQATKPSHLAYGEAGCDDVTISDASIKLDYTKFKIVLAGQSHEARTQLVGRHNLGPIAAAAAIAQSLGLTPEQIVAGIAAAKPFDHRLEVSKRGDVTYIDDSYNGSPDGAKAAISYLAAIEGHRRFYVTPGLVEMGPRTELVHKNIGKWLAKSGIEQVVLVRNDATELIAGGLTENNFQGKLSWFDNAQELFKALPNMTVSNDVVLLQNDWPDQYS